MGVCSCGHDLVDYVSAVEGDSKTLAVKQDVVVGYGIWAAASRRVNYLVPPVQWDARAWQALHALVVPAPDALLPAQHTQRESTTDDLVLDRVSLERSLRYDRCRLSPNSGLDSLRPSVVSLPSPWQDPLVHVGAELMRMVPSIALERLAADTNARAATRHLSVFPGINGVYLHTESLQLATLQVLSSLASAMYPQQVKPNEDTLASRAKAHPIGQALLQRTIRRVLSRGYADGARVALGRYAPELYDRRRTRPKARQPWALICLTPERMPSARIAWTLQPGTH